MVHDFMITRDHVIFPIMPLTGSMERAMRGAPVYAWEPEKGVHIGIMPRNGSVADMRWFKGDPAYVFHPMNAHSDGDVVMCDVCEFEEAPLFPMPDGTPGDPKKAMPRLTRWTFDLGKNSDDYKVGAAERHRVRISAPGRTSHRARTTVTVTWRATRIRSSTVGGFNGIGRFDHHTGKLEAYDVGAGVRDERADLRAASREIAAEGEGYLLANVYDAKRKASHLVILDAQNVAAGPLATAYLDHRVPFGFHGNWAPANGVNAMSNAALATKTLFDRPPVARVAALADVIADGGDRAQQMRRLPDDTVAKLVDAGFFRFTLPRELGGEDASALETIEMLEAMAAIDASVAWNVMLGSEINAMAAGGMDPNLAKEVYLDNPRRDHVRRRRPGQHAAARGTAAGRRRSWCGARPRSSAAATTRSGASWARR